MTTDSLVPPDTTELQIIPPGGDTPGTPLAELARAVSLAMPTVRDPRMVALVMSNMLHRRGFAIVRQA